MKSIFHVQKYTKNKKNVFSQYIKELKFEKKNIRNYTEAHQYTSFLFLQTHFFLFCIEYVYIFTKKFYFFSINY